MTPKTERIDDFLRRLKEGPATPELKAEIEEFLSEVPPKELYAVEKRLLEAGLAVDDLLHRCSIHMDLFKQEQARLMDGLHPKHLVCRMLADHEVHLAALDEMELVNKDVQQAHSLCAELVQRLLAMATMLDSIRVHARCEDDVIFPEVERHGELGPSEDVKVEHEEIFRLLDELQGLCRDPYASSFEQFRLRLDHCVNQLTYLFRDHLFREVFILYPMALRAITDDSDWERLSRLCCKLGYCEGGEQESQQ